MNKEQIEQALRDYRWMINEIKRQRKLMGDYKGGNLVAQGGIESAMPKAKGVTGDPVADEVVRRHKNNRWLNHLEEKVSFIQERIPIITDQRERAVLECMLDGLSMKRIGQHMGLSRTHIYNIKESIIEQFEHFGQIEHKKHNVT